MKRKELVITGIFILFLSLLSFAAFWRILYFDFFQDDSIVLWSALYNPIVAIHPFQYFRHPGSLLEFFTFAYLFGKQAIWWQLFGIVTKIATSYLVGIFAYRLTKSGWVGTLSAVFFATSYIGMDSLDSPLMTVPVLVAIAILASLIYLMKALTENKKYIWHFLVYFIVSFLLDPGRAFPLLGIVPFFLFFFPKSANTDSVKKFLKSMYITFFVVGIPLFFSWYLHYASDYGIQKYLQLLFKDPKKIKDIGNFLATVANAFTEPIYGLTLVTPFYEFADYARPFGILGIGLFVGMLGSFFLFLRKKSQRWLLISFFLFWAFAFYFPNWLAEPRAPMAAENHYLFISSIGIICLISFLVSSFHSKILLLIISFLFVAINIYKANVLLAAQFPYRSASYIEKAFQTMVATVPHNEAGDVFLLKNGGVILQHALIPWGDIRYLLVRGDKNYSHMPFLTDDEPTVFSLVCPTSKKNAPVPLSHVFTWKQVQGVLVNQTQKERNTLEQMAEIKGCKVER